jgi:hypothetical protein
MNARDSEAQARGQPDRPRLVAIGDIEELTRC